MKGPFRFGLVAAAALLVLGYCATTPHSSVEVPWPDPGAQVRIEIRGILSEDWWIVAETPGGRFARAMWTNWGPARTANLYRTEEGGVAVVGAGMLAATLSLPPRGQPREVAVRGNGRDWRYLGVVTISDGPMRFLPASAAPECIALYGIGSVPVRADMQRRECATP
ncbi:hypothetical protein ACE7GA_16380 [Roseomonas sp. CCTCC AB2023176]|uniref:hypothetical protein n=1 Tax=Roseomonas sp. CCTCC AB2023176 TaxID=3342640 RepID=UPI0035DC39BD